MGVLALVALLVAAGCAGGVGPADVGVAGTGSEYAAAGGPVGGADDVSDDALADGEGTDDVGAEATPNASTGTTTVRASAVGSVEAEPDQATLRVAVTATAANATAVRDRMAEDASSMLAALSEAGVPDDRIRTVALDIREDRPDPEEPGPVRFRGIHAFEITVTNVSRVGTVLDAAVTGGASEVDRVAFGLSAETRREVRDAALRRAMADARSDAGTVAAAAGLEIVGVRSIVVGESDVGPVQLEAAAAREGDTPVQPGPVTVTARVEVVYDATATGTGG